MEILIRNRSRKKLIPATRLRRLTQRVLERLLTDYEFDNPQVSVLFVDDAAVRSLNKKYRGKDAPTDVLSFPMLDASDAPIAQDEITTLGDIVISLETAARQSREIGHRFEKEITLLIVHGFLHLLNYDDEKPAEKRRMFALQKKWMKTLEKEIEF